MTKNNFPLSEKEVKTIAERVGLANWEKQPGDVCAYCAPLELKLVKGDMQGKITVEMMRCANYRDFREDAAGISLTFLSSAYNSWVCVAQYVTPYGMNLLHRIESWKEVKGRNDYCNVVRAFKRIARRKDDN